MLLEKSRRERGGVEGEREGARSVASFVLLMYFCFVDHGPFRQIRPPLEGGAAGAARHLKWKALRVDKRCTCKA